MNVETTGLAREGKRGSTALREVSRLCHCCSLPAKSGRDEEVDEEIMVAIMSVDEACIAYVTLEATANTAPVTAVARGVETVGTRLQWCEVTDH